MVTLTNDLYPLLFNPVLKDYIWGGRNLETKLGRELPAEGIIAESWEIAGHKDGTSVVANGRFANMPLTDLHAQLGLDLIGTHCDWAQERGKFPLLIKILDANRNLSVQVHPNDDYALENEGNELGKTEMWVILHAEPNAKIILGVKSETTPEKFQQAITDGKLEPHMHTIPVKAGDVVCVPAGSLHAIMEGLLIAEIQQNSNTTYRVYDWNRLQNGKPRPLHIDKALDVINFQQVEPSLCQPQLIAEAEGVARYQLCHNEYFVEERVEMKAGATFCGNCDGRSLEIWGVIKGSATVNDVDLTAVQFTLLPAALGNFQMTANEDSILLRTYVAETETLPYKPELLNASTYNRGRTIRSLPDFVDPKTVVSMSSNENAVGTSPKVIEAVAAEAALLARYPPSDGEEQLRQALVQFHGGNITSSNLLIGNGGLDVLDFVARGFAKAGDNIIMSHPTFRFFQIASERLGVNVINVPLGNNFQYDVDTVLATVNERTRVVYLCNPNNPTGNTLTKETYDYLLEKLPKRILILSDEAYSHFADDDFVDTTQYVHEERNIFKLYSFSKAFGLAGLRLGYGITTPEIAEYLAKLKRPFHLGRLTIVAGLAALGDQEHLRKTISNTKQGRGWLTNQMGELGVKVWPSQGNFLLMDAGIPGDEITAKLMEHGVIVSSGQRRFGLPDHIRVTVGLPEQNQRFVDAMSKAISN